MQLKKRYWTLSAVVPVGTAMEEAVVRAAVVQTVLVRNHDRLFKKVFGLWAPSAMFG